MASNPDGQVVRSERATLVCNSIGSISGLQAAADRPDMVDGVMIVNPNFRELHEAEQPDLLRPLVMPVLAVVQSALRTRGQALFDALAKPDTVKQILKEPYCDPATVRTVPFSCRCLLRSSPSPPLDGGRPSLLAQTPLR
jgi:pimeloyl-ACP methyl ester carboxylesterase